MLDLIPYHHRYNILRFLINMFDELSECVSWFLFALVSTSQVRTHKRKVLVHNTAELPCFTIA